MTSQQTAISISAVIPAYNAEAFIARPIESILAQTYPVDEIIVVDDGSADRTAEVAAGFPRTRVIRRENGGQAAARNTGISAANGDWIAFLDHDDEWHPQKTAIQMSYIAPEVGVVHANRFDPIHFGNLWHRQAHITPSGALVRKQALLDAGCFEESRTVMGVEDLTLWLKIALTRWTFVRSPEFVYRWRQTGANQSNNELRMARADLACIAFTGGRVHCQPEEMERIKQASRIEYTTNLIAVRHWSEVHTLLQECTPGVASRWLALAAALRISRFARTSVVRWLHPIDAEYGEHPCSAQCTLPESTKQVCREACANPYYRPPGEAWQSGERRR